MPDPFSLIPEMSCQPDSYTMNPATRRVLHSPSISSSPTGQTLPHTLPIRTFYPKFIYLYFLHSSTECLCSGHTTSNHVHIDTLKDPKHQERWLCLNT